ncbi:MAG: ABC transporter ATP-binding protein [Solirubrobacteraceae bacterium]
MLTDVSVELGGNAILADIRMSIAAGELICLIGPSGCGKTTLLNAVAGLVPTTSGEVLVDGAHVAGPGPDRAVVFQDDAVFPWMRVERNVGYGLRLRGVSAAEIDSTVESTLALVGLSQARKMWPRELSGGMRKRVDLARALAVEPPILLMDEPYGALDMMTKERLQVEFERIHAARGMTVMFVTHDLEEAIYLADRVVVMSAGPGRIASITDVPFPRPRPLKLKLSDAFQVLRGEIGKALEAVSSDHVEMSR